MVTVHRAAERFVTEHPGVRTWSSFSAGPHYDPYNLSFGPVIGCDEHLVEPGAGFDWHAHRGVVIISWVLAGTLRHEDDAGFVLDIDAAELLVQSSGDGVRHRETNPSGAQPLRFVQTTLLLDLPPSVGPASPPARVGDVIVDLRPGDALRPGDTRRDGRTFAVAGQDVMLVVEW